MNFLYGILGFLGYEGVRIYRKITDNEPFLPAKEHMIYYCIILIWVGLFAGLLAYKLNPSDSIYSIYIGFSVPSIIKVLIEKGTKKIEVDAESVLDVEDFEITLSKKKATGLVGKVKQLVRLSNWYFARNA